MKYLARGEQWDRVSHYEEIAAQLADQPEFLDGVIAGRLALGRSLCQAQPDATGYVSRDSRNLTPEARKVFSQAKSLLEAVYCNPKHPSLKARAAQLIPVSQKGYFDHEVHMLGMTLAIHRTSEGSVLNSINSIFAHAPELRRVLDPK